jgi:hypothetical protein
MSTEPSDFQYSGWNADPKVLVYMGQRLPRPMTLAEVLDERREVE